ncbi:MAG: hypothetical protein RL711_255 [Bacteroidota bacterium]|jgi:hypothetical protein
MKKYSLIAFLILLLLSSFTTFDYPLNKTEWKVEYVIMENGVKDDLSKLGFSLFFHEKYFSLFLDENECTTQYQLEPNNGFSVFVGGNCTKHCCDHEKGTWIKKRIYEIKKATFTNDTLKLQGENFWVFASKMKKIDGSK